MDHCNTNLFQQSIQAFLRENQIIRFGEEIWTYSLLTYIITAVILTYLITRRNGSPGNSMLAFWFSFLIIGALVVQIPNLAQGYMHVDESQHIGEAYALAENPIFWESVDGTTVGPMAIYIPTLLVWSGIHLDYASIRILNILLWSLISYISFLTILLFDNKNNALWITLIFFSCFPFFFERDYVSFNGEVPAALFLSISLYFALKLMYTNASPINAVLLGMILVLTPLTKLQVGPVAFMIGLIILFKLRSQRRTIVYFIGSVFVTLSCLLFYLFYFNVFNDFIQSYFSNNVLYTSTGMGLGYNKSLLFRFLRVPLTLLGLIETRHLLISGFLLSLYHIFKCRNQYKIRDFQFSEIDFLLLIMVIIIIVIGIPGHKYYHYTIMIIPTIILIIGLIYKKYFVNKPHHLFMLIGFIIIPQSIISAFQSKDTFTALIAPSDNYRKDIEISNKICELSEPGFKIAQWGYDTYIYSETYLLMGTRDAQTHRHIHTVEQRSYYIDRYVTDLNTCKPEFFIDNTKKNKYLFDYDKHNFRNFREVKDYVLNNYHLVFEFNGAFLYARNDLDL